MVLVVDCGTQRMKVMLFEKDGELLDSEVEEYSPPYFSPEPGWAEQDAEYYWKTFLKLSKRLLSRNRGEVEGISVTTQRDSLVLVDGEGKPLRSVILWLDHRKAEFDLRMPPVRKIAYKIVGMWRPIISVYREAKLNWIRQNEPRIWKRTHKVLQISGFFIHRLTGRFVDSVASQIGHIPFDYKRRRWAKRGDLKSLLFPVEREKLPELVEAGTIVGKLRKDLGSELGIGEVPVVASGSDKGCETVGLGVLNDDTASLSLGTTATIQTTTSKYFEPLKFLPPYPSLIPGMYNPEVEIFRGFWLVRWFKEEFGHLEREISRIKSVPPEKLLDEMLDRSPPGSMGLMVQPYWTPGLKMPEAKGAMIGFSSFHKREHVYRSLIEGVMFALREGKDRIERAGKVTIERAGVAGGGSKSEKVCQIAADVLGLPVYRERSGEAAGLGAAISAYVGLGVYGDFEEAVEEMVEISDWFEPDPKNHELYTEMYEGVYRKMYGRLKKLYEHLDRILR